MLERLADVGMAIVNPADMQYFEIATPDTWTAEACIPSCFLQHL